MKKQIETAEQRAWKLYETPMNEMPKLARAFNLAYCKKYGGCGDTTLTAFTIYAQLAEGLACKKPTLIASAQEKRWFGRIKKSLEQKEKV